MKIRNHYSLLQAASPRNLFCTLHIMRPLNQICLNTRQVFLYLFKISYYYQHLCMIKIPLSLFDIPRYRFQSRNVLLKEVSLGVKLDFAQYVTRLIMINTISVMVIGTYFGYYKHDYFHLHVFHLTQRLMKLISVQHNYVYVYIHRACSYFQFAL